MLTRRECLIGTGTAVAGLALGVKLDRALAEAAASGIKVGMCDWSIKRFDPSAFDLGKQIGHFILVQMQGRGNDVRRRFVVLDLQDVLTQIGLHRGDTGLAQHLIE